MKTYVIRKLLWVPPMLLAISILAFLAIGLVPKINIDLMVTDDINGSLSAELWHRLGNDQPIWLHYLRWMGFVKQPDGSFRGVIQGDLGQSLWGED